MSLLVIDSDTLDIVPWEDERTLRGAFDPRSGYVERFWLALIGPSTTWLLRRIAAGLDASPGGFSMPLAETARAIGLGDRAGRHSAFVRTLSRMVVFDLARPAGPARLEVLRRLPPLSRRQLGHLSVELQRDHEAWTASQGNLTPGDAARRRSRQLALSLLELGEEPEEAERQLMRWRYHPAMANESVAWAVQRHRQALDAAAGVDAVASPRVTSGCDAGLSVPPTVTATQPLIAGSR